jgi:RHS repeat-associated protein
MRHVVAGDPAAGWTRHYEAHADSNELHYTWTGSSRVGQIEYFHDAHGNMLNLVQVGPGRFIGWDHRDMISTFDLGGGGTAFYQYDASKKRVRKRIENRTGGGYWERVDLGGYELYRRYNGANAIAPVEEIETLHLRDGAYRLVVVDQILRTTRPGLRTGNLYRYALSNHLGSATVELDEDGSIISVEEHHPYGSSAYVAGRSAVEAKLKRYRFAGMERDEESGLGYHAARYYAPWLGRWTSVDPFGLSAGMNLFSYANDSPVGSVDMSGLQADAATEEKLRKLGIGYGVKLQGWKISVFPRPEAPQAPSPTKPPRPPRKPARTAKPAQAPKAAPAADPPPPKPLPYADFDPTVPIPKDDEPVVSRDDIPVIRAEIAPALREAQWFIERAKKGEYIHPAVMEATLKKLGTAGHALQIRGDAAQDLTGTSWELARIGREYWQHRATGLLAAAERGEVVAPQEASLVQLQLLGAARQSDDEVGGALRDLAYKLAPIRERAVKSKLERALQGDPWAGRAWLAAEEAQEAERQKQLLGTAGEEGPSELQGVVTELGAKRERVLQGELNQALRGELPPEHARGVAKRAFEIERSKQLLGLVEGNEPSRLAQDAESVLRR